MPDQGVPAPGVFRQHDKTDDLDANTGAPGNFPQAFTHLALVESVSMLIDKEPAERSASNGLDPG